MKLKAANEALRTQQVALNDQNVNASTHIAYASANLHWWRPRESEIEQERNGEKTSRRTDEECLTNANPVSLLSNRVRKMRWISLAWTFSASSSAIGNCNRFFRSAIQTFIWICVASVYSLHNFIFIVFTNCLVRKRMNAKSSAVKIEIEI